MSPELQKIIHAIAITQATVKVIDDGVSHLHPVDAAAVVRRYERDRWSMKTRKDGTVKWVRREREQGPMWQRCYRTAEAPVMQPSVEWLNSRRGL